MPSANQKGRANARERLYALALATYPQCRAIWPHTARELLAGAAVLAGRKPTPEDYRDELAPFAQWSAKVARRAVGTALVTMARCRDEKLLRELASMAREYLEGAATSASVEAVSVRAAYWLARDEDGTTTG